MKIFDYLYNQFMLILSERKIMVQSGGKIVIYIGSPVTPIKYAFEERDLVLFTFASIESRTKVLYPSR